MAEEDYGLPERGQGPGIQVLVGSAPDANAAMRTARRLVRADGVRALIGGYGAAQARALAAVAEEQEILFLNIGSASDSLRGPPGGRRTFHVEASASSYLDALIRAYAERGFRRWFLLHGDGDEGRALHAAARDTLEERGDGVRVTDSMALPDTSAHAQAFAAVRGSEASIVLLLLDWRAQLDFLGHYEASGLPQTVTGFPQPVTQTREFLASLVRAAPGSAAAPRVSLWEAARESAGASELSRRFRERWGVAMDSPAWAAYAAVRLLAAAYQRTRSAESGAVASELIASSRDIDIFKGATSYFRESDHQLQQPLYLVEPDPGARDPSGVLLRIEELPSGRPL